LDALRALRVNELTGLRVSGFGARLSARLDCVADTAATAATVLLWNTDTAYVHEPATGRTVRLSRAAAELAEALLVCGSVDAAEAYADPRGLRMVAGFFADAGIALGTPEPAGV